MKKIALIVASLGVAAFSHAVTWNILTFPSAPQGVNASAYTTFGMTVVPLTLGVPANGSNAITLLTPNGGVLGNNQFGSIFWEYEASNFAGTPTKVMYSVAGQVLGDGQVIWQEQVFGVDGVGNEFFLNSASGVLNSGNVVNNGFGLNGSINLPQHNYSKLRVKKLFNLVTGSTPGTNYASVGRINQAIVPEPTSMAALGLGLAAVLRRRNRR
ncbi:MAG: PEP-CTERM sorting domain-containing protein [Chthonomonas sp.]|nr:PEP-CTERM sorting domain-containing protein [Chthonomonas sp.]